MPNITSAASNLVYDNRAYDTHTHVGVTGMTATNGDGWYNIGTNPITSGQFLWTDRVQVTPGYGVPNITVTENGQTFYGNLYNHLQPYVGQVMDTCTVTQIQTTINNFNAAMQAGTGVTNNYSVTIMPDGTGTLQIVGDSNYTWMVQGAPPNKSQMVKSLVQRNLLAAARKRQAYGLTAQASAEELKARETLRDLITEAEWRRYVTNGFIMTKGQSGKWYRISNYERVAVYENGKQIETLCIHSSNECPPTDHVINMKILAEIDEEAIWSGANKHGVYRNAANQTIQANDVHGQTYYRPGEIQYIQDAAGNQQLRQEHELLPAKVPAPEAPKNLAQTVKERFAA
jgi:hypothetical protein